MTQVNVYEAKTQLSRLLDRALEGEEVVIARAGRPLVRLVPVQESGGRRPGRGAWAGQARLADDFDVTPPNVLAAFGTDPDH